MAKKLSIYPTQGYALIHTGLSGNAAGLYPITKIAVEQSIGVGKVIDLNKLDMSTASNLGDTVFYRLSSEIVRLDESHVVVMLDGIIGQVIYKDAE